MATLVSTTQQQLGLLFDAVAVADRVIAQCFAFRAELIDQTRRFSEAHAAEIPRGPQALWSREEIAQRELSSELAVTLRIPERSAETLLAESKALVQDLPATRAALHDGVISYRHAQATRLSRGVWADRSRDAKRRARRQPPARQSRQAARFP